MSFLDASRLRLALCGKLNEAEGHLMGTPPYLEVGGGVASDPKETNILVQPPLAFPSDLEPDDSPP